MGEPRFADVFLHRPFFLLWTGLLASSSGAFLFVIVLAARIFEETQSALMASSIFAAQWLLPLALARVSGTLCTRHRIRSVLIVGELVSAGVVVLCALALELHFGVLLALVMVRGFLEALTKAARMVALKQYVEPRYLEKASSLFGTSMYLSSGIGAIVGGLVAQELAFFGVSLVAAGMSIAAVLVYVRLAPGAAGTAKRVSRDGAFAAFRRQPELLRSSLQLFVICGVFQGFHNVARTALPMKHLPLGLTAATNLQVVSSVGIVLGALFVYRFMSGPKRAVLHHPLLLVGLTALAMPLPYLVTTPWISFALYFVFIFAFEVAFTRVQNEIVVMTPVASMGHVAAFNQGVNTGAMAVVVVAASAAIDATSVLAIATALAGVSAVISYAIARARFEERP